MKRVSDRQKKRNAQYKKQTDGDSPIQKCKRCGTVGTKRTLERHHPHRRLGKNLFIYIYLCAECHRQVEETSDPEFLIRDNSTEKNFHDIKPGENFLRDK